MSIDKIIKFTQDTAERKGWFEAASFAHPAKMHLSLQFYLIEHYTKVGDIILDPMTGSGTILVGCALGRNVVCVELEKKFVKMIEANWEKIKSLGPMLGYTMGSATILQGDARQLPELLVDKCVFSPPFADSEHNYKHGLKTLGKNFKGRKAWENKGKVDKIVTSPPYAEAQTGGGIAQKGYQGSKHSPTDLIGKRSYMPEQSGKSDGQISNLPYGKISAVISSPPHGNRLSDDACKDNDPQRMSYRQALGKVDIVCTSPPYENAVTGGPGGIDWSKATRGKAEGNKLRDPSKEPAFNHLPGKGLNFGYSQKKENIGNLKSENYLQAMFLIYQNCHKVLKERGLIVLVVKNFIRDKKIIRLDLDTIKLCEQVGFVLVERLKRKLTQISFWRRIYMQKYPDAPTIDFEDILIFEK